MGFIGLMLIFYGAVSGELWMMFVGLMLIILED